MKITSFFSGTIPFLLPICLRNNSYWFSATSQRVRHPAQSQRVNNITPQIITWWLQSFVLIHDDDDDTSSFPRSRDVDNGNQRSLDSATSYFWGKRCGTPSDVTAVVIAEKSPAVFVRTRDARAPDFLGFLLLARVLIPPGTSGCPIVRVHGSIVWRLYPLRCTRDKVRRPAGGHRSLDPPVVRDSLSYVAFSYP